jgi:hypothetical protein
VVANSANKISLRCCRRSCSCSIKCFSWRAAGCGDGETDIECCCGYMLASLPSPCGAYIPCMPLDTSPGMLDWEGERPYAAAL